MTHILRLVYHQVSAPSLASEQRCIKCDAVIIDCPMVSSLGHGGGWFESGPVTGMEVRATSGQIVQVFSSGAHEDAVPCWIADTVYAAQERVHPEHGTHDDTPTGEPRC
jgi:hypothetical protein